MFRRGPIGSGLTVMALLVLGAVMAAPAVAAKPLHVQWMVGFRAAGTPDRLNRVGVLKVGSPTARNVLVLEPGTSAASPYFLPLARWIVATRPGWQVWSIERRENLLEDQSKLDRAKQHRVSANSAFDYYLGWLQDRSISPHLEFLADSQSTFAKAWGMQVAVEDLHRVIAAAHRLRGHVVLGGHSLGGSVVTAYATWNFNGRAGARDLAGLVLIDGASFGSETAADATAALSHLNLPATSPWLTIGGIPAPYAGVFEDSGAATALLDPNGASRAQSLAVLPAALKPPVPVTNLGQYGYALNVGTSPTYLALAQGHLGRGLSATGPLHGWDGRGALTPIRRFAQMFEGDGVLGADGTEWYFPTRLTDDTAAVGNGIANPAQSVLGVRSTLGRKLPHSLRIYAFGAALGQALVPAAAQALAKQSGIPSRNLTLVNAGTSYAHNDPAGAFPDNRFFTHLIRFLRQLDGRR